MKNLTAIAVAVALLVPMMVSNAVGQKDQQPQIHMLQHNNVIPAKAQEFEALMKDWVALYKKHKFSAPIFTSVNNFTYTNRIPFADFANLDKLYAEGMGIVQKDQQKLADLLDRAKGQSKGQDSWFLMSRPELSYVPSDPRLASGEILFLRIESLYIEAADQPKVEALFRELIALSDRLKFRDGFTVGAAITGTNLPFYTFVTGDRNSDDYWVEFNKRLEAMGEEGQRLYSEIVSLCRDYDVAYVTVRPDLSYIPE